MPLNATESARRVSVAMREGSAAEHAAAERSPFVSELVAGRVNERGYADYLRRLRVVYAALEDAVRSHRDDPMVSAVYDPALERLAAIDADLDHWAPGAGGPSNHPPPRHTVTESPAPSGRRPGRAPLHALSG